MDIKGWQGQSCSARCVSSSLRRCLAAICCCTSISLVLTKQAHAAAGVALTAHHINNMLQRVLTVDLLGRR